MGDEAANSETGTHPRLRPARKSASPSPLVPSPSPPLSLSPEMVAACARQDVPAAGMAELRAQIALIGERARRVAITAEYERLLLPPNGTPADA